MSQKISKSPKFRSGFEKKVYESIPSNQRGFIKYEPQEPVVTYNTPSRYIPDFLLPNGILVECKGYFDARARSKMLRVKKQNPNLDIRFLFQRANNKLTKSPNSLTYWQWCDKHGFKYEEGDTMPQSWLEE